MTEQEILAHFNHHVKRQDLPKLFGCSDRAARKRIEQLQEKYNIVNLQDGKGYFLADNETALKYAKQERSRAKASYIKASRMIARCSDSQGEKVFVRAHFRTIGKKDNVNINQISMEV